MKLSDIKISPLEGTPALTFSVILSIVFVFLAMITDGFLTVLMWILSAPFLFMTFATLYGRLSKKWGRIHYPLMVRYASYAGMQMGATPDAPSNERTDRALAMLLVSVYPKATEHEIQELYSKIAEKDNVMGDKEMLMKTFRHVGVNKSHEELEKIADDVVSSYNLEDEATVNGLKVRHIISEVIRFKYGEHEQLNYIYAVVTGNAK